MANRLPPMEQGDSKRIDGVKVKGYAISSWSDTPDGPPDAVGVELYIENMPTFMMRLKTPASRRYNDSGIIAAISGILGPTHTNFSFRRNFMNLC